MSNSLDFVGPDLGPNCLQSLSADDTSRQRVKCFMILQYSQVVNEYSYKINNFFWLKFKREQGPDHDILVLIHMHQNHPDLSRGARDLNSSPSLQLHP